MRAGAAKAPYPVLGGIGLIRRDVVRTGQPASWLLITQIAHAQLSYELARDWCRGGVAPLAPRDDVLAAVLRHDDGWRTWEQSPDVDPQRGEPLSFLEMPIDDAIGIWEASIEVAQQIGPLVAYLVSAHFSALVQGAHESHASNPHWLALVDAFLAQQNPLRAGWLADWQAGAPAGEGSRSLQLADRGLAQLQLFDALSLWLCMAERTEPDTFPTPAGPDLTWTPISPTEITVAPWPWDQLQLRLEVLGRLIPQDHYPDRESLAQAPAETLRLQWILRPAAG